MSKNIRRTEVDHLFEAILTLKDKEECYTFLKTCVQLMNYYQYHSDMK